MGGKGSPAEKVAYKPNMNKGNDKPVALLCLQKGSFDFIISLYGFHALKHFTFQELKFLVNCQSTFSLWIAPQDEDRGWALGF